jgi:DNA-binding GntR family transcriptional regulator
MVEALGARDVDKVRELMTEHIRAGGRAIARSFTRAARVRSSQGDDYSVGDVAADPAL